MLKSYIILDIVLWIAVGANSKLRNLLRIGYLASTSKPGINQS